MRLVSSQTLCTFLLSSRMWHTMIISTCFLGTPILLGTFSSILVLFWILHHDWRVRGHHLHSTYICLKPTSLTIKSHFCQLLILSYPVASLSHILPTNWSQRREIVLEKWEGERKNGSSATSNISPFFIFLYFLFKKKTLRYFILTWSPSPFFLPNVFSHLILLFNLRSLHSTQYSQWLYKMDLQSGIMRFWLVLCSFHNNSYYSIWFLTATEHWSPVSIRLSITTQNEI